MMSVVFLGGVALEAGPIWSNLPGPYMVVADVRSIEPEGIQVSSWAYSHLGENNRVSTDRINRLLMSTYGHQRIVTGSEDKIDVSPVFYASTLDAKEIALLREAKVHYLVVDLRLSTSLPLTASTLNRGNLGHTNLLNQLAELLLQNLVRYPRSSKYLKAGIS